MTVIRQKIIKVRKKHLCDLRDAVSDCLDKEENDNHPCNGMIGVGEECRKVTYTDGGIYTSYYCKECFPLAIKHELFNE